jgi:hypothetical protein
MPLSLLIYNSKGHLLSFTAPFYGVQIQFIAWTP